MPLRARTVAVPARGGGPEPRRRCAARPRRRDTGCARRGGAGSGGPRVPRRGWCAHAGHGCPPARGSGRPPPDGPSSAARRTMPGAVRPGRWAGDLHMTSMRPTGEWNGTDFAHEAFLFATDQEVLDRIVPFAMEGLSRGEPVLVVAGKRVRRLLAEELGQDVRRLATFAAAETWWRGGHGTLHAYDRDLRTLRAAVPTWRLVAEPVWLAREDGREWSRFEAVANRCYAAMPYYSLCLHDRRRLPADVLDAVARTHPLTWGGGTPVPDPAYEDPRRFLRSAQPAWEPRPGHAAAASVTTPWEARRLTCAAVPDDRRARVGDVVLAAHELVLNALSVAAFAEVAT